MLRNLIRRLLELLHLRRDHVPRLALACIGPKALPAGNQITPTHQRVVALAREVLQHELRQGRGDAYALPLGEAHRTAGVVEMIAAWSQVVTCRQGHPVTGTWCWTCDRGVSGCDRSCYPCRHGGIVHGETCERPPATAMPGPGERRS